MKLSDFESTDFYFRHENETGIENKLGNGLENQDLIPKIGELTVSRGDKTVDGRDKTADNRDRVVGSDCDRVNDEIKEDNRGAGKKRGKIQEWQRKRERERTKG